jgi:hypothetical protein
MKEPYWGVRLLQIWNSDTAYRVVENKAKNHFGESNIVKLEVVMLPKNSHKVKSLFKRKK